ncbi:cytidine monophosphate-N-acetylneuraminic acid hydroxylase-like isoform X3 [Dendrobates tinctorius]|uniref:cytidine monophosphate-N-acetylneuraminic acid hydroxylase-like isoform X3 n=1 Tax=Dendrobates tinctorius TaxID=92724 RepID=UPI003CC96F2D
MELSVGQTASILLHIAPVEVASLKDGINFLRNKDTGKNFIIFKDGEALRACKNVCKHQGGTFIKDIEDLDSRTVRCTKHNWKLDVSTMKYVNPPDSFCQEELVIEKDEEDGISLVELYPPNPWDADPKTKTDLEIGELQITYLTHACMELKLGETYMVFDPWLTGPAFARGWWLLHEPPSDWLERLCRADLIYISHMHSDHLSYPTLKKLSERRPDVPIFVGNTERPVFWYLDKSGITLTNINVVPFGVWQQVNEHLRFMILMDGVHPEMDTCIIVEYKGHKILNTVDCTRPNGNKLPMDVAVMMSDFAGGASGFPMTFSSGKFTEEWKSQFIKTERKKLLNYKAQLIKDLNPYIYCPFAGYFVEAHPSDRDGIAQPPSGTKILKDSWDFDTYLDAISVSFKDEIFSHPSWVIEYFTWAGFKDYNLVVRMIETDDDFNDLSGGFTYLVDFSNLSFPTERPSRNHAYEEIRTRATVMRHVVKNGLLWDDLYIGFQTRIQRDPDIYHHQFWNHFQIKLPLSPPDWEAFLIRERQNGTDARSCNVM